MSVTATQRTIKYLRDQGFTVGIVEKWNHVIKIRQDLWGFADMIAFADNLTAAVQSTVGGEHARHRDKLLANVHARRWAGSALRVVYLISWSKCGDRGKRKLWVPRLEIMKPEMFTENATCPPPPGPSSSCAASSAAPNKNGTRRRAGASESSTPGPAAPSAGRSSKRSAK